MSHTSQKQIWAVGSGKGGVGKSLISSSLAYTLSKLGHSTLAVDLDLGGANLHTVLGLPIPSTTVSSFLRGEVARLEDCVLSTPYPLLNIIGAAQDDLSITKITGQQAKNLMDAIRALPFEFIVLDLGAGTDPYTIDFFLGADQGILTVLPEPTSIENAYRFIKTAYYQRILNDPKFSAIDSLVESAMLPVNKLGIRSPSDLMKEVHGRSPDLAADLKASLGRFKLKLVVNQARSQTDVDIGFSIKSVVKKYFGADLDYLGYLEYESNIWQSVRRMRPMIAEFPHSKIASHIERMTQHLLKLRGS